MTVALPRRPTAAELIGRARALAPVIAERAARCEAERRVPAETVDDFRRAGLLRMCQPARYCGAEIGWDVLCEVSEILAAACGSQAWLQHIYADHTVFVATFPAPAQDEVWARTPDAIIAASLDPVGRAREVDGGFRFRGQHGFASGIDYADWLICGGMIEHPDRLDGPHYFLVPKSAVRVCDDWDTMALEGTGSKSFVVEDAFVPAHRRLDGPLSLDGRGPGIAVNAAAVYRLPRFAGVTSTGFAALAVGMAAGVLEAWLAYTGTRMSRGVAVAAQPSVQVLAARCAAEIDAARALYRASAAAGMRAVEQGLPVTMAERLTAKRNVSYACQLALKAGTRLFNAAGGRALFRDGVMQRQYRNLLGAVAHHGVAWESAATEYGAGLLAAHGTPWSPA